ncbi:MAG: fibronectin type III domain-containing protein [Spirochaetia bacterium]
MKKQIFFYCAAAITLIALAFTGCSSEPDFDPSVQNVTATASEYGEITIAWDAVEGAFMYSVYVTDVAEPASGDWEKVDPNSVSSYARTASYTEGTPGTTYYFKVEYNKEMNGPQANQEEFVIANAEFPEAQPGIGEVTSVELTEELPSGGSRYYDNLITWTLQGDTTMIASYNAYFKYEGVAEWASFETGLTASSTKVTENEDGSLSLDLSVGVTYDTDEDETWYKDGRQYSYKIEAVDAQGEVLNAKAITGTFAFYDETRDVTAVFDEETRSLDIIFAGSSLANYYKIEVEGDAGAMDPDIIADSNLTAATNT